MKRKKQKYVVIGAAILAVIAVAPCIWLFVWPDLTINMALRVYPNAQGVSSAYGYWGASVGLKVQYYWTADPLQNVQRYYEKFAAPFVVDSQRSRLITYLSVDGSELVAHEIDGERRKIDSKNPVCHYTQPYKCLNISLYTVSQQNSKELPNLIGAPLASSSLNATPYLASSLKAGTLIVYSYYIEDD